MKRALSILMVLWFSLVSVISPVQALTSGQDILLMGRPGWVKGSIDINAATGQIWAPGAGPIIDSRSGASWCQNTDGSLVTVATATPCRSNQGYAAFEARTNSVRNNTMAGAVVSIGNVMANSSFTGTVGSGWTFTANGGAGAVNFGVTGQASVTGDGTNQSNLYQGVTTVIGHTYNVLATLTGVTSAFVQAGNSIGASGLVGATLSAPGTGTYQFVATATTTYVGIAVTAASTFTVTRLELVDKGVAPNNWTVYAAGAGLSEQIVGLGTESGYPYIDIRTYGVATATIAGYPNILTDTSTAIAATYGQTWTLSHQMYLVAGSIPGTSAIAIVANNAGGGALTAYPTPVVAGAAPLEAYANKYVTNATQLNSATAHVNGRAFQFTTVSGTAYDFTVRMSGGQLELNPNIPASVASAVKAADGAGGVNGSGVYSVSGGTCATAPQLNVTWAAGVLTVNSVANAGSCSVLSPSPATLAYVSGAATGWTGATVTLTPTDNSAQAFATPPILTSAGAITRNADNISMTAPSMTTGSLLAIVNPLSPSANPSAQVFGDISDGTFNNRLYLARLGASTVGSSAVAGTVVSVYPAGSLATGSFGKASVYETQTSTSAAINNGAVSSLASTAPNNKTILNIGSAVGGSASCNCYISRIVVSPQSLLYADGPTNDNAPRFAGLGDAITTEAASSHRARAFARAA